MPRWRLGAALAALGLLAAAPAWGAPAAGPTAALGGAKCSLGADRVVAAATKPGGPFSVKLGLGPSGGALVWDADSDAIHALPVGPRGEPLGSTPVADGGALLGFRISHLLAVQPVGEGYVLVGWGFSDLCRDACVVAQPLDARAAPVGAPAVYATDSYLSVVGARVVADATGLAFAADFGKEHDLHLVHVGVAGGVATIGATPLGVRVDSGDVLLATDGADTVLVWRHGTSAQAARVGPSGVTLGPVVTEGRRMTHLSTGADGVTAWFDVATQGGVDVPAQRRTVDAAAALGPAVVVGASELPLTFGRLDIGSGLRADGQRVEGLLFDRWDALHRWRADPISLTKLLDARIARDVVVAGDRWVAAWVGLGPSGWQVVTREARCPR